MARIQTPIGGISTTSVYDDGATFSLVNLRPKNGALHPVSPRKVVQELAREYDIVFVHRNNDYENWIGIKNGTSYFTIYWDILSEEPQGIASFVPGMANSIQQIGNTLSVITSINVFYLLFQNNNYTFLGELPQIPAIELKTSDLMSHAKYYFVNEYASGSITSSNFIDATKGLVNKAMNALMNGWTDKNGNFHEGSGLQFFDACFIRYAFRLYDGTLTKHSPPILVMPVRHIVGKEEEGNLESIKTISYDFDAALKNESCVDVYGYKIYMCYDFSRLNNWKDIIQSIDIFVSAPLGISNIENIRNDMPTSDSPKMLKYNLIKGLSPETMKNVINVSIFYFMKSIPLGSFTEVFNPEEFPSTESDITKMENIIYQEVMTDDNFSNHKYGAAYSYVYNGRLHLGNIKTLFFGGFNMNYFQWLSNYNGIEPGSNVVRSFCIEVELLVGSILEKVYSFYQMEIGISCLFASAFLSYPDPRAKRITIYEITFDSAMKDVWKNVFSRPLQPHESLSIACYLNNGLQPIVRENDINIDVYPDYYKTIILSESNKIKVSELNNPFNFSNKNTYQVGNGSVLSMATNAMNISDRNFGQYPLYVFTSQGIWTLSVGNGDVVYSTQTAPVYTQIPTSDIVCETPYGIVFTTQRGLMLINGQSVEFISPQMEQKPPKLILENYDNNIICPAQYGFVELLKNLSGLIYNPCENELIINIRNIEFNYILNFDSRQYYQTTEKIDIVVGNQFPDLFVASGNVLKNYALSESPFVSVGFALRPLQYGTTDKKRMERIILNGLLHGVTNIAERQSSLALLYCSNDGVNFSLAKGFYVKSGNKKDIDMGLLMLKSRQFIYTFIGTVEESTQLYCIDAQIEKEYNNTKIR